MRLCVLGFSEPLLLAYVISAKLLYAGSFKFRENEKDNKHTYLITPPLHSTGYEREVQCSPFITLFDLILYIPSTIFQLCREGSSWVEQVLS